MEKRKRGKRKTSGKRYGDSTLLLTYYLTPEMLHKVNKNAKQRRLTTDKLVHDSTCQVVKL